MGWELVAMLDVLPEIVHVYDAEWRWVYLNPGAAEWLRSLGRDPETLIGRCVWDEFPEARSSELHDLALRAVADGREAVYEARDEERSYRTRIVPFHDGALSLTTDITEEQTDRRRTELLGRAGSVISDVGDATELLQELASLAVEVSFDFCVAYRADGERLTVVACRDRDYGRIGELQRMADGVLLELARGMLGPAAAGRLLRSDDLDHATEPRGRDGPAEPPVHTLALVPLRVEDQPRGVLAVGTRPEQALPVTERDLGSLGEVMHRASMALALRRARDGARAAAERTRQLQRATAALATSRDLEHTLDLLVTETVVATDAYMAAVYGTRAGSDDLELLRHIGLSESVMKAYARAAAHDRTAVGEVVRTKKPVFVDSAAEWRGRFGFVPRRDGVVLEHGSWVALPLMAGEELLGVMALGFDRDEAFPEADRAFLAALGNQCARALERARDDEALRRSEARFRATFEHAAVGIAHVTVAGAWLHANRRLCEILGYSREELFALTFDDIAHPDDLPMYRAHARSLSSGEIESYRMEQRCRRKDGATVWTQFTGSLVRDRQGRPDYCIAIVEDVTGRKNAERRAEERQQALDLERRRLSAVLDVLPAGVWISDAEGRIVERNRAAVEIWGGLAPHTTSPGDYHVEYQARWPDGRPVGPQEWGLARALKGERTGAEEVLIRRPDGTERTILNYGIPIPSSDASPGGAVALSIDITDRKAVEDNLLRATAHLHLLVRAASRLLAAERAEDLLEDIVADLDTLMGVDVCFHYVLEEEGDRSRLRVRTVVGAEELQERYRTLELGQSISGAAARDRRPVVLTHVEPARGTDAAALRELGVRAYACYPLIADDRLLGTVAFGTRSREAFEADELGLLRALADQLAVAVDRVRSIQSEQEARRQAERANHAKSAFLATVSHELRTPLNAVIGYADLLGAGIPEAIGEGAMRHVRRIRVAADHLLQLIEEVLTFSRLEAGREQVSLEDVDLAALLGEIRTVTEPLASDRGLALTIDEEDVPGTVRTDPRKLRQILLNLLGNAVKFTAVGEVRLTVREDDGGVQFRVADTGIGISEDHMDRLFEPFWQADPSSTRTAQGSGLGLTICQRFAEMLGGSIGVRSELGQGTTFTVRLPGNVDPTP